MGRFETYGYGYEFIQDGKIVRIKSYKDIPTEPTRFGYTKISYKGINNLPYGKMHWFARLSDGKYEFEQFKSA